MQKLYRSNLSDFSLYVDIRLIWTRCVIFIARVFVSRIVSYQHDICYVQMYFIIILFVMQQAGATGKALLLSQLISCKPYSLRRRQWGGIFHYYWWTASLKPRLLFYHANHASLGLSPFLRLSLHCHKHILCPFI